MAFDVAKIAFCFFFLLSKANCQIWQGEAVESKEKFPYHAHIETFYENPATNELWSSDCGGLIVGRHFVLTAGHCVPRWDRKQVNHRLSRRQGAFLYFGMLRRAGDDGDYKQRTRVEDDRDFMVHRNWRFWGDDIALVHTRDEIRMDSFEVARAVLGNPNSMSRVGWECEVSGWGYSTAEEIRQRRSSPVLKFAAGTIQGFPNGIQVEGGNQPRRGDSGGPLSCHPRSRPFNADQHKSVYGVFSEFNLVLRRLSRYVRISAHTNWISRLMARHEEEPLLDGRDAVMGQYPHQAAVIDWKNLDFKCSGAIVSEWWVLSGDDCFENGQLVVAGEVDLDNLQNMPLTFLIGKCQARVCVQVAKEGNLQLCRVERAFRFNGFVQRIDLWPQNFLPVIIGPSECHFASWFMNAESNRRHTYLRWKRANFRGKDGKHLDVGEVDLFRGQMDDMKSAGAGLVCGGADGRRYLVGMSEWQGRHARFVDVREYRLWINNNIL